MKAFLGEVLTLCQGKLLFCDGSLKHTWISTSANPEPASMDWSHLIAKLRRVALWIRVILATPFHLQRLKSSKVHLIALSPGTVFSFPYTREGKELKMRLLSSLAPASGCGAAPSGLLSETAGNTALLHLPALWQISTSHMLQEGSSPALQSL